MYRRDNQDDFTRCDRSLIANCLDTHIFAFKKRNIGSSDPTPYFRCLDTKKPRNCEAFSISGASWRIRTSDRLVRSQVLYPAELRTRSFRYRLSSTSGHYPLISGASWRIRTSDRLVRSQVLYPAELRTRSFRYRLSSTSGHYPLISGASWRIRTSDRLVRSQVLYPAELRTRRSSC